jgi:hypothetical protein
MVTPDETGRLQAFFTHCALVVRNMAIRSEFGEHEALAMIDEAMLERGATLRFEVTVGAAGPVSADPPDPQTMPAGQLGRMRWTLRACDRGHMPARIRSARPCSACAPRPVRRGYRHGRRVSAENRGR